MRKAGSNTAKLISITVNIDRFTPAIDCLNLHQRCIAYLSMLFTTISIYYPMCM